MRTFLPGALIAILTACSAGGMQGTSDPDSALCGPCEAARGDDPCLRRGIAMAGDADWLILQLDNGADSTAIGATVAELASEVGAYLDCVDQYYAR